MNYVPDLGTHQCDLVTSTAAKSGEQWCAIYCIETTVFTTLTGTVTVTGNLADASFAAGTMILGNFTAFTLASGAVVAYRAE